MNYFSVYQVLYKVSSYSMPYLSTKCASIIAVVSVPVVVLMNDLAKYWVPYFSTSKQINEELPKLGSQDKVSHPSQFISLLGFNIRIPTLVHLPIISYLNTRWKNRSMKMLDITTARNALIFLWIVAMSHDTDCKISVIDYVSDRLTNSSTRKNINREIQNDRRTAYASTFSLLGTALDTQTPSQLRDATLQRRNSKSEETI